MKKQTKRILTVLLTVCITVVSFGVIQVLAADVMPLYNNTLSATPSMSINDDGLMTITFKYSGMPSTTTKAVITTYVEKRFLGFFWTRVDIANNDDDQWVDTVYDYRYTGSHTLQLSSKGTYRVTVKYKIYGTGGAADEITRELTASY